MEEDEIFVMNVGTLHECLTTELHGTVPNAWDRAHEIIEAMRKAYPDAFKSTDEYYKPK